MKLYCLIFYFIIGFFEFSRAKRSKLLVIAFDGFRWDYLSKFNSSLTQTFQKLIKNGVYAARGMHDVDPTLTYPNFMTLDTGLYAESHGVVGNSFFDPALNLKINIENITESEDDALMSRVLANSGPPLWYLNQANRGKSVLLSWPFCPYAFKNISPFHCDRWRRLDDYDLKSSYTQRMDTAVNWLSKPDINLVQVYFDDPDHTGHSYGPQSIQVEKFIYYADTLIFRLLRRLKESKLSGKTDIIITADHGFSILPPENVVDISKWIDPSSYDYIGSGFIKPKAGMEDRIVESIRGKHPHIKIYRKAEIPTEFHLKNNPRVSPLLIVPDVFWSYATEPRFLRNHTTGTHGYVSSSQKMHAIFIASGPSFKVGYSIPKPIESVDFYPLACHLLGLSPAAHNGSLERIQDILRESSVVPGNGPTAFVGLNVTFIVFLLVIIIGVILSATVCLALCRSQRAVLRRNNKRPAAFNLESLGLYSGRNGVTVNSAKALLVTESDSDESV